MALGAPVSLSLPKRAEAIALDHLTSLGSLTRDGDRSSWFPSELAFFESALCVCVCVCV